MFFANNSVSTPWIVCKFIYVVDESITYTSMGLHVEKYAMLLELDRWQGTPPTF